ncbi:MAG: hypothetical protein R3D33_00755 [Hyphomicrobiaceae bacterium]
MGCDIHFVVERRSRAGGGWIGLYSCLVRPLRADLVACRRDYDFFAELARVRGDGSPCSLAPRGLPEDASELARQEFAQPSAGFHTPTHVRLSELVDAWVRAHDGEDGREPAGAEVRPECAAYDLVGVEDDAEREHRVVLWFDS